MSDLVFKRSTDSEHVIELESSLISATWLNMNAPAGMPARFEIITALVGEGAKIKVTGTSERGARLGQITSQINRNRFFGELTVPESIALGDRVYFTVDLPDNNITGESNHIEVTPAVRVRNLKWSATEARRGDVLTLTADTSGLTTGSEVELVIYEYDNDGIHDRIAVIPTQVTNNRIELQWEYEYHEDSDDIPTQEQLDRYGNSYNPPEYFFTVRVNGNEFGTEQQSGLLEFKDWVDLELADADGNPLANERYVIIMPDGTEREGELDSDGRARIENVPPGPVTLSFPGLEEHDSPDAHADSTQRPPDSTQRPPDSSTQHDPDR